MLLRQAYAATLRLIRARRGLNQTDFGPALDASHISRLESASSGVTLESSESLAQTLKMHPLSLLVMAYAVKEMMTTADVLQMVRDELTCLSSLEVNLADQVEARVHPQTAKSVKTKQAIQKLKAQGVGKAEVARQLGISISTVDRRWNTSES